METVMCILSILILHAPLSAGAGNVDGATLPIICITGAAITVAVGIMIWAALRKRGRNASQKRGTSGTAGGGISMQLEVYAGKCKNKSASLELHDCLTIGSAADCDIIFDDAEVAPLHSRVRLEEGHVFIEDLGSSQGTALYGMRIQGQNRLRDGETICMGQVEFSLRFSCPEQESP